MTLNDLKNEVANLGFESRIENVDCFISSANRALNLIYTDRPVSKTATIFIDTPKITFKRDLIVHKPGEKIQIPIKGGCFSFRATGSGNCFIEYEKESNLIILSGRNQSIKRELKGDATLVFDGDKYFTVNRLAVFEYSTGISYTDIPEYVPTKEIPIRNHCYDFRYVAAEPTDALGRPIKSLVIREGSIFAPFEFCEEIYLTYFRCPTLISDTDASRSIDVSDECAHLLPLLTASFMWLDDDAGKAQYYMSLYRDAMANIRRYSAKQVDTEYRVNGWA